MSAPGSAHKNGLPRGRRTASRVQCGEPDVITLPLSHMTNKHQQCLPVSHAICPQQYCSTKNQAPTPCWVLNHCCTPPRSFPEFVQVALCIAHRGVGFLIFCILQPYRLIFLASNWVRRFLTLRSTQRMSLLYAAFACFCHNDDSLNSSCAFNGVRGAISRNANANARRPVAEAPPPFKWWANPGRKPLNKLTVKLIVDLGPWIISFSNFGLSVLNRKSLRVPVQVLSIVR